MNVHSGIIPQSPKVEITRRSTDFEWMTREHYAVIERYKAATPEDMMLS